MRTKVSSKCGKSSSHASKQTPTYSLLLPLHAQVSINRKPPIAEEGNCASYCLQLGYLSVWCIIHRQKVTQYCTISHHAWLRTIALMHPQCWLRWPMDGDMQYHLQVTEWNRQLFGQPFCNRCNGSWHQTLGHSIVG